MTKKYGKYIQLLSLTALLLFCCIVGGTVAYWSGQGVTNDEITMGNLDGALVYKSARTTAVYPGDVVQSSACVTNAGGLDLIVRLKVNKGWADKKLSAELIEITFNTGKWLDGGDGYFYYRGILKPGATTENLFDSFKLSETAGNAYMGQKADIEVSMECLQSTADAISSWGKTYAQLGISRSAEPTAAATAVTLNKNKSFELPKGSDLFANFKNMTPGEQRVQAVTLKNEADLKVEMFLSAESAAQSGSDKTKTEELLKKYATVTVTDPSGKTLYSGPLEPTDELKKEISLGSFAQGDSKELTVTLKLDPAMGNEYQKLVGKVKWTITAKGADGSSSSVSSGELPKTGDLQNALPWACGAGICLILLAALLWLRKRRGANKGTAD